MSGGRNIAVEALSSSGVQRRGFILIAIAAVLWGTVGISTRTLYELTATDALSIGFFRLALATPAMVFMAAVAAPRGVRLSRRDTLIAILVGVLLALYQWCYFTAISLSGVTVATLVTLCTAPVIAALVAVPLAGERLSWAIALALVLALVGTALLIGVQPHMQLAPATVVGASFALGSAAGYALLTVCGRLMSAQAHPLLLNRIAFPVGALLLLLIALPSGLTVSYPPIGWGLLLYLGLVPTALAYALFFIGMRSTAATSATIITLLEPLTATLLATALFEEQLPPLGLVGGALLLAALGVLYSRKSSA
ncbi:DMT family transporter [Candidatus Gracilibacteria bacterium]|nr:DMT family transporter [Candidatus Gracilibacteria bacterium]